MLKMVNEYYINPVNITYMEIWQMPQEILGTIINFNSYAAVCSTAGDTAWEPQRIFIKGLNPTQIADSLNNEPAF